MHWSVKRFIKQKRVHSFQHHHHNMNDWTFPTQSSTVGPVCACAVGRTVFSGYTLCSTVMWPTERAPWKQREKDTDVIASQRSDCFCSGRLKETLKSEKSSDGASHYLRRKDARERTLKTRNFARRMWLYSALDLGERGGLSGQSTFTLRTIFVLLTLSSYVHPGKLI